MDDQGDVLAFLGQGAGLGAPRRKVTRIDTHASAVFLIGERAYKLKRAVRYSYLDYSTLEQREAACRTELEINRRIAPALYLGVRAIRRDASGTLALDGEGRTLDWVIEMRRFDTERLFDRLAERRALTPALMREAADVIAAFHAEAAPAREGGGSAGIARVIAGNTENLRAAGAAFDQDAVARLDRSSRAALTSVAALLDRRRDQGKVRSCHGDLHLGNICVFDGKPTLFDAIEFSPAIATIDVLYDFAFLLMDLDFRTRDDLANLVLNRYLDLTRDDDGLTAMPLFMSVRAAVRAHVSAAAAPQQKDAAARAAKEGAARHYLALAATLLEPAQPVLVAVGGRSGSGKSTIAQAFAHELPPRPGARVLRSDVLRKAMLDLAPEAPLPASAYSHAMGRQVYARMQQEANRILRAGRSVILDATFLDAAEREGAELLAANVGVPFTGMWLEAKPAVMMARLKDRRNDASDATIAVLENQLAADPGAMAWRRIDSGGTVARAVAAMRRAVKTAS